MPLIVCSKCGCVENTHLVNKDYIPTLYDYSGDESLFYPNMDLRDMQGHDDFDIVVNGKVWKAKDEIKMLCSECNNINGWHNEFNKDMASGTIKELSKYSKYGYITPFDQDSEALIHNNDAEYGYEANVNYGYIFNLYRKLFNPNHTGSILDDIKDRIAKLVPSSETRNDYIKLQNFYYLYLVFRLEKDNFHLSLQGDFKHLTIDWCDTRDVCLIILDSIIDMSKAGQLVNIIETYHNVDDTSSKLLNRLVQYEILSKHKTNFNHNDYSLKELAKKELTQTDLDKIAKAEEKRKRKLNKKIK